MYEQMVCDEWDGESIREENEYLPGSYAGHNLSGVGVQGGHGLGHA